MSSGSAMTAGSPPREMVIERIFDVPRELVFKAWTDPKHVAKWWGPKGFTNPVCEVDARPGGTFLIQMTGPDGTAYPTRGVFHEVVPPERLVVTSTAFEDADGNPQLEVLNTVTFAERDGKTKLTLRAVVVKSTPELDPALAGMNIGWSQSLDKLAESLGLPPTPPPGRHPGLDALGRLVGTWQISGGANGIVTYEWMEGEFFLIQYIDLDHDGHQIKAMEVIGQERMYGADPSRDIKSRVYDNEGNTLDYVYELEGDTLTIWAGVKNSPAYFRARFNEDGNSFSGDWVFPGGGGYHTTATRIETTTH